jgi:hypothetical protein
MAKCKCKKSKGRMCPCEKLARRIKKRADMQKAISGALADYVRNNPEQAKALNKQFGLFPSLRKPS